MGKPQKVKNREIVESFLHSDEYKHDLLFCDNFDRFYLYTNGYYKEFPTNDFHKLVWNYLSETIPGDQDVTPRTVRDAVQSFKWHILNRTENLDSDYIAFKDQLYNIRTFQFEAFDRRKITGHYLPFETNELGMRIPKFRQFLNTTLVKNDKITPDEDLIKFAQEMFGYLIGNNLKAETVFFLVGGGSNGKSVLLKVLEKMIGREFVSAMSIETLTTDKFSTATLVGKKVNICTEEESKYVRSDRFKSLVSGDLTQAERKYEGNFAFHPTTKYVFASNKLPTFDDVNYGLKRRIKIIPFKRKFLPNKANKNLYEELLSELPGIVAWALEGLQRLSNNDYVFGKSTAVDESLQTFENNTSSALMYFSETYMPSDRNNGTFISNSQLYKQYQDWAVTVGKRPLNAINFHRDLKSNIDALEYGQSRTNGAPQRGYYLVIKTWVEDETDAVGGDEEIMTTDDIFSALKK